VYEEDDSDVHLGWPTYVDFLASFSFVLILFIACLVYLVSGVADEAAWTKKMQTMSKEFKEADIDNVVEGRKLRISLKNKVSFQTASASLPPESESYLRTTGSLIGRHPECGRVVVQGFADSTPFKADPFGNWSLSAQRALRVLQFFYLCTDCGYGAEVKKKLVLAGDGSQSATDKINGSAIDRRVDIVLDCGKVER
jgi:flagellar motor protein MotB